MRSPDADVERIEGLLRGMPPESEREAHIEGLIRELRTSQPRAPRELRERVRRLREPEPRRRQLGWRPALVLVPIALAFVGAALLGDRGSDAADQSTASGGDAATLTTPSLRAPDAQREVLPDSGQALEAWSATVPAPAADRAQEWDVQLELAVRDNDRLSDASAQAIRTTRDLGGFVVSSDIATRGRAGEARLVVRVPQRRIQDAIARFSSLGTITGQQVSVQDRQGELDRLARRIDTLRIQRAELNAELARPGLSAAERLRLELRRQRIQGLLNQLTRQRANVAGEVAMAEVALTLRTQRTAAMGGESRFDSAVDDAVAVLAVAAAVAVFLLIVLAPLALLALLGVLARRSYRRRDEQRILDRPTPARE